MQVCMFLIRQGFPGRKRMPKPKALRLPVPEDWPVGSNGAYAQLSLVTCDLATVPYLADGEGYLKKTVGEEAYVQPADLLDTIDVEAFARSQRARARRKAARAAKAAADPSAQGLATASPSKMGASVGSQARHKSAAPQKKDVSSDDESDSYDSEDSDETSSDDSDLTTSSDDESDESDDDGSTTTASSKRLKRMMKGKEAAAFDSDDDGLDDESEEEPDDGIDASEQPGVRACASLSLQRNHLRDVPSNAFERLPFLCVLDLSVNHLAQLQLRPSTVRRLTTLSLRNNQLETLGPLCELGHRLKHLDIAANHLRTLDGIGSLPGLRVLVANGNSIKGELPADLGKLTGLVLCDLEHNMLACNGFGPLRKLRSLSTLRLAHNELAAASLPRLAYALGRLSLRRLTLYGNPLQFDPSFPDALTRVQPTLYELDHVRLGGVIGGGNSRHSVAEAVDAIANSALAQHAVLLERHRAAHDALLETLKRQQAAAKSALLEYRAITSKAEDHFRAALDQAKRTDPSKKAGGANAVVDRMLRVRQQLLTSERVSLGRYREAVNATTEDVQAALRRVTEGETAH